MDTPGAESARYLAANGSREWKNKKMLKAKRDATTLEVMEYVIGDEHTFDFWVQDGPNGKIKAVRPKLVAWMDMRSRAIVGDVACIDANSQTLKESLVKMIYASRAASQNPPYRQRQGLHLKGMTGQNRKSARSSSNSTPRRRLLSEHRHPRGREITPYQPGISRSSGYSRQFATSSPDG
jgi:hypothetical protein